MTNLFKQTETGYTLQSRLKMSIAQMELIDSLQVGDTLKVNVVNDTVTFAKDKVIIGEADPKIAQAMIEKFDYLMHAKVHSIHKQFGVVISYTVSTIEPEVLTLDEIDEKKSSKPKRRNKLGDLNRFGPVRTFMYVFTLILSVWMLIIAIQTSQTIMIVLMVLVATSSVYLLIDQIHLYKKHKTND